MIDYFERRAAGYQQNSERGLWRRLRRKEFYTLSAMVNPVAGQTLIDLGCGAGYYSVPFKNKFGLKVVAVDSSPGMLKVCAGAGLDSVLSSVESLKPTMKFDHVFAAGLLEFVENAEQAFQCFHECAKPGSNLVLLFPAAGAAGRFYKYFHEVRGCRVFVRSIAEYGDLAARAGFEIKKVVRCTPISVAMAATAVQ